jgi:hypothetical protein
MFANRLAVVPTDGANGSSAASADARVAAIIGSAASMSPLTSER